MVSFQEADLKGSLENLVFTSYHDYDAAMCFIAALQPN
jgi:hypothetical protein